MCLMFVLVFSFLCGQVRRKVQEGSGVGSVHQVLLVMLRGVQVCSFWNLWKQAPVPLLQGQCEQEGQVKVPLKKASTFVFELTE